MQFSPHRDPMGGLLLLTEVVTVIELTFPTETTEIQTKSI